MKVVAFVLFVCAMLFASAHGFAQEARRAGTVRLQTTTGGRGPIELRAGKDGYTGELAIANEGKEPLILSRIAIRGDAADPRVPPKVTARLLEGSLPVTIAPGTSRKAVVQWTPDKTTKQRQLFGHVVVTSSDEQSGEVALGIRAQLPGLLGPLEGHLLSFLLALPLIGAIVVFALRAVGKKGERAPQVVASIVLGVQTFIALYIYRGFNSEVSRMDGTDGLQFVEHGVWVRRLSLELFLGVDGISAAMLVLVSIITWLAIVSERGLPQGAPGYHAAILVLDGSVIGALSAQDAFLFVLFAALAISSTSLLAGAWTGESTDRRATLRVAIPGALAIFFLLIAVIATARHADPTFLVDGTKVTTTFSIPELSRVAFGAKDATFLALPLSKIAFVLVVAASVFFLAGFPAHGWMNGALASAPTATGVIIAAGIPAIGVCALLRLGCSVLPEGMRWASGVIVALGAVTAAFGALATLAQTDLRRIAACATTSHAGFVLLGAGSLTPQGMSGAIVIGTTRILACGVFLLLAGTIADRVRTRDVTRLVGFGSQMPGWSLALGAAALAQAGVLGLAGAWGPLLAVVGALPSYAPLAITAALALVVIAGAHISALSRVAFGTIDPSWERSAVLEPFGGRLPDLTAREWLCIAPLATLIVVLGVWPAPVINVTTGTVRDLASSVSGPGPDTIAER